MASQSSIALAPDGAAPRVPRPPRIVRKDAAPSPLRRDTRTAAYKHLLSARSRFRPLARRDDPGLQDGTAHPAVGRDHGREVMRIDNRPASRSTCCSVAAAPLCKQGATGDHRRDRAARQRPAGVNDEPLPPEEGTGAGSGPVTQPQVVRYDGGVRIYLVRHGDAVPEEDAGSDRDRWLSSRGREAARVLGRLLREQSVVPDRILASPLPTRGPDRRAPAASLDYLGVISSLRCLEPAAQPRVRRHRRSRRAGEAVLVVSHEPAISALGAFLLGLPRFRSFAPRSAARSSTASQHSPRAPT